jgi:hypothetical protein
MATQQIDKDVLRAETMLALAREITGLHDVGDMRWYEPASRWLDAVIAEAPLSAEGTVSLQQSMLVPITTRLRIADLVRRHPEILDEDVSDPVIVVGMPRTGTTKLQRALASDPEVQSLPLWRLLNPVPLDGEGPGENHARMAMAEGMSGQLREHFPDFFAGHPITALEPEEEAFAVEFDTQLSVGRAQVPSYLDWWMARPHSERAHMYDYLRTLLQVVQWQDGCPDRPFVLKSPMHLGELPCLAAAFPHATVVNTHREIETTVASSCRIIELLTGLYADQIDLDLVGQGVLTLYADDTALSITDRAALGDTLHVIDVCYEDVRTDCLDVVRRIWAARNRELSPETERRITGWEQANPQHRFGRHTYSLERYGLTTEAVLTAFGPYLNQFPMLARANASPPLDSRNRTDKL